MIKTLARISLGVGLVIVGIIGLILPIMPGWVFLVPGLVVLSDYIPPLKRLLTWARRRLEKETAKLRGVKQPGAESDAARPPAGEALADVRSGPVAQCDNKSSSCQ